jgi:hypothetical protein
MGLEDTLEEFANDVTGQGGSDGDNNANNADGSNDKTVDTFVDSGKNRTPYCPLLAALYKTYPPPKCHTHNTNLTSTAIDQFASKEGVPAGMDPEINNLVNEEINKF